MSLKNWFLEKSDITGTAFGLKIRRKLHEEQTPYQFLEIYETETFGNLMVLDGFVMLTTRDNFIYHEMMTHPALFSHSDPKNIVIIGGGDCGCLRECLKHPNVMRVTQIDIDEAVTRASEKYFPELCNSNDDPRADLRFDDGIKWIQNAEAGSLDVIIIDSTDPVGPAVGLFAEDFYAQCLRALGSEGILIAQSESPLINNDLLMDISHNMRAAGFTDTGILFYPQTVYPSGWWTSTIARKSGLATTFRESDAEQKSFMTQYYNAAVHRAALALPEFMRKND